MALFNESACAQPLQAPTGIGQKEREMSVNERVMDLTQRMVEKDKQINELVEAITKLSHFVGFIL